MDHQASQTGNTRFSVFPLRFLITVPVLLLALAASGLVGIFSYFDAGTAVGDVAAQLRAEVLARVDQRLREYLAIPPAVNAHNVQSLALGILDPDDPRNRRISVIVYEEGKNPFVVNERERGGSQAPRGKERVLEP